MRFTSGLPAVQRPGSARDVPGAHGALMLERAAISSDLREVLSISAAGRLRRSWTAKLRGNALAAITVVVCSMLAGALYTLAMGEDVNWDWQNYHEYNVWDRCGRAGLGSSYNLFGENLARGSG
ncbi:hypothetical protein [Bradyrhizobium sp. USDA 223]|uniref:hypothetical protein n=1 Tax=Bradyrhizobium sp. USDA 223 TaxID=3156306 RepID=UPI0038372DCD